MKSAKLLPALLHLYPSLEDLELAKTSAGKPYLPINPLNIHMSVSHSETETWTLLARHSWTGLDIQFESEKYSLERISERFFPEDFKLRLNALPAPTKTKLFYKAWTMIEALIKAQGSGLANISYLSSILSDLSLTTRSLYWGDIRIQSIEAPPTYAAAAALPLEVTDIIDYSSTIKDFTG